MEFQLVTRSRIIAFLNTFIVALFIFAFAFVFFNRYFEFPMIWIYLAVFLFILACAPVAFRYFNPGRIWLAEDHVIVKNRFKQMHQYKFNAADHINVIIRDRGSEKIGENNVFTIEYFLTPSFKKAFAFVVPQKELKNMTNVVRLWKEKGWALYSLNVSGEALEI